MKLYDYFRSSAAYRIRIALNLKGLSYDSIPINLRTGEQCSPAYRDRNPQGLVPALETPHGLLSQSLAIMEWLDEAYPESVPLLPGDTWLRAQIRSLAGQIACDIHPLNNLRVLHYLQGELGVSDTAKSDWYAHWVTTGFEALEPQLSGSGFCIGEQPTLADICLIPQVYNALRFKVDLSPYPAIRQVYEHCNQLEPFQKAAPENQADASV
ncbi:maleylacetoacetate isomerase [Kistimonas asteriae]|uniref:maleylacetoacetate isomerase n=1 Tax=Kistimonas asteriae TaxID=517724 RepID=UPI001BA9B0DE|nr:maleylacetoacetate isomerase [Kistimonas asteriae]